MHATINSHSKIMLNTTLNANLIFVLLGQLFYLLFLRNPPWSRGKATASDSRGPRFEPHPGHQVQCPKMIWLDLAWVSTPHKPLGNVGNWLKVDQIFFLF